MKRPFGFAAAAPTSTTDDWARDDAFAAVWAAEHDRALAALHNAAWPGSRAMRGRVYARGGLANRLRSERDAAGALAARDERVELALLVAESLAERGARAEALLALDDAERLSCEVDRTMLVQVRVTSARVELRSGYERAAMAAIAAGFALSDDLNERPAGDHRLEANHLRAALFELRARVRALRHDDAAQLDDLCRAVTTAKLVTHRDAWLESGLLASISNVVGTFPQPTARQLLEAGSADVRWNAHVAERESAVRFNLARARMLFGVGESLGAAPKLGTPSLGARLALDADRLLFDDWPDRAAYERELDFAAVLAERVEWGDVASADALGLATLALLLAPSDLARARAIQARYDRCLATLSREADGFLETRRVAFDDLVAAVLATAAGDAAEARALFDGCIDFWDGRAMHAWSAIARLERHHLSRDDGDLAAARRYVAAWPRARFAGRLRRALAIAAREPDAPFPFVRSGTAAPSGASAG